MSNGGDSAEIKVRLVLDKAAEDSTKKFVEELKSAEVATKNLRNEFAGEMRTKAPGALSKVAEALHINTKATDNWKAALGMAKTAGVAAAAGVAVATTAAAAATVVAVNASLGKLEKQKALAAELLSLGSNKNISTSTAADAARAYDRDFRRIAISAGVTRDEVQAAFTSVASGSQQGGMGWVARLTAAQAEQITRNMSVVAREVPGGLSALTASYDELKNGTIRSESAIVQMITASGRLKGTAVDVSRQLLMMAPVNRLKVAEEAIASMAKTSQFKPKGFEGLKNSALELKDLMATSVGDPIVNALLPRVEKGINYLSEHADDIENAFRDVGEGLGNAADYVADKFQWIFENKDALAATFRDVFGVISDTTKNLVNKAELLAAKLGLGDATEDRASAKGMKGIGEEYAKEAGTFGKSDKEVDMMIKRFSMGAAQFVQSGEMTNDEIDQLVIKMRDAHKAAGDFQGTLTQAVGEGSASKFAAVYNAAVKTHNQAQIDYALQVLSGSSRLQKEILSAGSEIEGGLTGLANMMRKIAPEFSKDLNAAAKTQIGTKALQPQVNFNGNTFNIRQDFRDQDPDRIALVFQSDILRSAQARAQAKGAMPFGL